jgi:hypothetical protein
MKRNCFLLFCLIAANVVMAQEEKEQPDRGFKKENFFTGGSVSLSFFNNTFLVGGSPVFGYSLAKWADLGVVANYTYSSYKDYNYYGDKLRQSIYGGGLFTRLFPVKFLFAQAQIEHNWIRQKYFASGGGNSIKDQVSSNSFLVGAGYTTGRDPHGKSVYGYLSILFDVMKETNSPYVSYEYDPNTGAYREQQVPIIRAGVIVPLFQGK